MPLDSQQKKKLRKSTKSYATVCVPFVWFGRARGSIAFSLIFLHPFFIKKTEAEGELNFTLKNEYEKLKRKSPKANRNAAED